MQSLKDRNVVVIGGSRGVGRVIVTAAQAEGAHVLAVARGQPSLVDLARDQPGVRTLALDATDAAAPGTVFAALAPDVLVLCGGATPPKAPMHEQDWSQFAVNWDTDVKASFLFCTGALRRPLRAGTTVILISSGAAIGGSPISGGYAGAKRMQMFMAAYCQKESDRLGLGLRFLALAPARIMPETELGKAAVEGYSRYLGIDAAAFIKGMGPVQTPQDVAKAVINLATGAETAQGSVFLVSAKGLEPIPPA